MKKTSFAFLAVLITLFIGTRVDTHAQGLVNFGLKGGLSVANMSIDDSDDNSARTGITVGAVLDIGIPLFPVGLETGLYYSQQGTTYDIDNIAGLPLGMRGTTKLDYLTIPVLAKVNFGPPGPFKPHFVAGPYASFILNAESEFSENGQTETIDISDDVETTDLGLVLGLGADINLIVTTISVQGRYSFGLTDVFEDVGSKNRTLSIVAGFAF